MCGFNHWFSQVLKKNTKKLFTVNVENVYALNMSEIFNYSVERPL